MGSGSWYRVDSRKVAHETIDGEVIMIHLVLGNYFSLDGLGADVWELLVEGRGREDTLALLEQRYDADAGLIAATVDELLARLAEEELVESGPADGSPAASNGRPPAEKQPFKAPELQKYTDMQDFLLVDPIHEVDETGWPSQNPVA
jgi:Coenzyme PQQ synthesis protein D (PqqD)